MEKKNGVYEIDLLKVAKILIRKAALIVVITIFCAIVALAGTLKFVTPQYTASILMYVNNSSFSIGSSSVSISSGDITAAKSLVSTYCTILTTRLTLEEVIDQADLDCSYEELKEMITSGAVNNTEIFKISIESPSAELSCKIANTIAKVLPQKISSVVEGSSVRVVDLAVVPHAISSPSYVKITAIAAVLGFVLSCGIVTVYYLVNERIDTEDQLVDKYGSKYPLLSVIPDEVVIEAEEAHYGKYGKYSKYGKYKYNYYSRYGHYGRYGRYGKYSNYYYYYSSKSDDKDVAEKEDK